MNDKREKDFNMLLSENQNNNLDNNNDIKLNNLKTDSSIDNNEENIENTKTKEIDKLEL